MQVAFVIVGAAISYAILYYVIKAAVRDGIIEARRIDDAPDSAAEGEDRIAQTVCPNCGREHDLDAPKCPYCRYRNG